MTPALTPTLALAYLRELSADVRGGVVLDPTYAALAGDLELLSGARAYVEAMGQATQAEVRTPTGAVFAVRDRRLAIVLVCGPYALSGLTFHDLGLVLGDLGHESVPGRTAVVPVVLAEALISAAQRAPGE